MSDEIVVQPIVYDVTVVEEKNEIVLASEGLQGPQGPVGPAGVQGEKGDKGETGEKGDSGGFFVHEQQVPSFTWTITHNLGYVPSVRVQDYGKNTIEGDIDPVDTNTIVLNFGLEVAGYAYLS